MNTYFGKVASGSGVMTQKMAAGSDVLELYQKATNIRLAPGTLNIEFEDEVNMPSNAKTIVRHDQEKEIPIHLAPAFINDLPCFIVRSKVTEDGRGRHSKKIVEVIASFNLRAKLELKEGDSVTVRF